ncbi:DUF6908 domain-containing protein [Nitrospira sp. M1]
MTGMLRFSHDLMLLLDGHSAVRVTVGGYMPLSIENIGLDGDRNELIAIMHWSTQNGDLMRDPEMIFIIHSGQDMAEPIEFRNDYLGLHQFVYDYDENGCRTHVRPRLKKGLLTFAQRWFKNIRAQGFWGKNANRDVLEG